MSAESFRPMSTTQVSAQPAIGALRDLRRARRTRRMAEIDWVDSLYRVYVSVFIVGFLVWWVAESLGDRRVSGEQLRRVVEQGPAIAGWLLAVMVAAALRSGFRGGPLAIEAADLAHVLQAPVSRRRVLVRPYVHQLRKGAYVGGVVGVVGGRLAVAFLPGSLAAWLGVGVFAGSAIGLLWIGIAAVVSGGRVPRTVPTLAGLAFVAWSSIDIATSVRTSPCTAIGGLLVAVAGSAAVSTATSIGVLVSVTVIAVAAGALLLGGVILERAERRSALVGQLRFAVSTQDLRAVLLLRRQLGSENPRRRPWFTVTGRPGPSAAIVVRALRSTARWPVTRIGRISALAVISGVCGRAAWEGALPLVVLAGLAAFVAGLDAIEPLSQDADHPDLLASFPRHRGRMANRQLIVPAVVLVMFGFGAASTAVLAGPALSDVSIGGFGSGGVVAAAFAVGVFGAVGGVLGAAVSVAMGPPSLATMLTTPELAFGRTMIAPGLSILAVGVPLVAARLYSERGNGPTMMQVLPPLVLVGYAALAWLTNGGVRDQNRV